MLYDDAAYAGVFTRETPIGVSPEMNPSLEIFLWLRYMLQL